MWKPPVLRFEQTEGKVDGFVCSCGSGGTLAGVALALQHKGEKLALQILWEQHFIPTINTGN